MKMPTKDDKMTVAELIESLQKIEDKSQEIKYADWNGSTEDSISAVRERKGVVELYFYR